MRFPCRPFVVILVVGVPSLHILTGSSREAASQVATSEASDDGSVAEEIARTTSPREIQALRERFIQAFERIPLNTTREDAAFLRIMVESSGAQRGLEVGTATGYGAILMGMGFERTGGKLITIDIDPKMAGKARANLQEVSLEKTVTVLEGDALKVIPNLTGTFDFVFLDARKQDYMKYFQAVRPMLKPGAVIVADNTIRFASSMRDFLDAMEKDPDYDMVTIRCSEEKGDGMTVIYKLR